MNSTFHQDAASAINVSEHFAIANQDENILICEPHLRGQCHLLEGCHHHQLPYQWQITIGLGDSHPAWHSLLTQQNIELECAYCQPTASDHAIQMTVGELLIQLRVSFENLKAECIIDGRQLITNVRRLSTCSYASDKEIISKKGGQTDRFVTQWRWYYYGDGFWQLFGRRTRVPQQYVLESKYLSGQAVYRFETERDGDFTISLQSNNRQMISLKTGNQWKILRRPLFLMPLNSRPLESPAISTSPFEASLPSNWSPVDADQDYELVPLDPSSMEYHLVASAFHESISLTEKRITDIFRIQNVFLWHKYHCKQQQMQFRQDRQPNSKQHKQQQVERQLFHGTRNELTVQAIFRQNFDWRLNGKANDVVYGQGAYFALNASFSDRYATASCSSRLNWMFLARVLVGRFAFGKREYVRPPPIDPSRPHGELYDSCVNDLVKPVIFVIFDSDQCYPEYVISYTAV